jgi:MscS family membrane protein
MLTAEILILNNDIPHWLLFAAALGAFWLVQRYGKRAFTLLAQRAEAQGRVLAQAALKALASSWGTLMMALALCVTDPLLDLGPQGEAVYTQVCDIALWLALSHFALGAIDAFATWFTQPKCGQERNINQMLMPSLRRTLQAVVVTVLVVHLLQVLSDQSMASILASLGLGGFAVAMGAKETIGNFFGSLVIFSDKPFVLGERIRVDKGCEGFVEQVGMRSTRLRTADGTLVTIPNADLSTKVIENVSRRPHMRKTLMLGLDPSTPTETLEATLADLRQALDDHPYMKPELRPLVFLTDKPACPITLCVRLWYHNPQDFRAYTAFVEATHLRTLKVLAQHKVRVLIPSWPIET